jgi:hypothetical protein
MAFSVAGATCEGDPVTLSGPIAGGWDALPPQVLDARTRPCEVVMISERSSAATRAPPRFAAIGGGVFAFGIWKGLPFSYVV